MRTSFAALAIAALIIAASASVLNARRPICPLFSEATLTQGGWYCTVAPMQPGGR